MTIGSIIHTIIEICLAWMIGEAGYQAYMRYRKELNKDRIGKQEKPIIIKRYDPSTDERVEDVECSEVK